jgi:hypothetical protein
VPWGCTTKLLKTAKCVNNQKASWPEGWRDCGQEKLYDVFSTASEGRTPGKCIFRQRI